MAERRFPPPWSVEVAPNYFTVRDASWQQITYVYYESEPGRRLATKLLSADEAQERISARCGFFNTAFRPPNR
jgi:hypothetical protein